MKICKLELSSFIDEVKSKLLEAHEEWDEQDTKARERFYDIWQEVKTSVPNSSFRFFGFTTVPAFEDVKKTYYKMAELHHSDISNHSDEKMKEANKHWDRIKLYFNQP